MMQTFYPTKFSPQASAEPFAWPQPFKVFLLGVAVLSCVVLSATHPVFASETVEVNTQQQKALGLKFGRLEPVAHLNSVAYPATLKVPKVKQQILTAPMQGLVTQVFRVHGAVEKGEAIIELQASQLLKLQKIYLASLSELKVAQRDLKRAQSLVSSGVVSKKQVLAAQSRANTLAQQTQQQQQDLLLQGMSETAVQTLKRTLRLQPARLTINAPQAGELYDMQVTQGVRMSQNQSIARVAQLAQIMAEVHVPAAVAQKLKVGQSLRLINSQTPGEIAYISHQADTLTQTVEVHGLFANQKKQLSAGVLETLEFIDITAEQQAYVVPQKAVVDIDGQQTMFMRTQSQPQSIRMQPVIAHPQSNQNVAIYFKKPMPVDLQAWQVLTQGSAAMMAVVAAANEGGE